MDAFDKLVEKHFPQAGPLQVLMEMVEKQIDEFKHANILQEVGTGKKQTVKFDWTAIPFMPVSELAWASLESNDKAAQGTREQLEQFISRIAPEQDLRIKIKNLSKVLNDPEHAMGLISLFGDTYASKIAATLSYLIFFKTLTSVITNFNAASAGFNFEAFLAVLLGGEQIPAAGAKTIADITDENRRPISLKLYAEKGLKAGGSYADLIGDLIRSPHYMQYIVVAKNLSGKATQRAGTIDFYRYNLTIDNIFNILYWSASDQNDWLIRLPRRVIDRVYGYGGLSFKVPEIPAFSDVKQMFDDEIRNGFGNDDLAEEVVKIIDYGSQDKLFKDPPKAGLGKLKGLAARTTVVPLLDKVWEFLNEQEKSMDTREIWNIINAANDLAREEAISARRAILSIRGKGAAYASASESVTFYNSLPMREKRRALMFTFGYQRGGIQYELRKSDIYNIQKKARGLKVFPKDQNSVHIGQLEIGQESIQKMLDKMITSVNESVFEIFQNIKVVSDSLQTYFANAMEDSTLADKAIESSQNIEAKTREVRKQEG